MKTRPEAWRDEVDLARVSADPRSIAVGWVVVFVMIGLGVIAPTLAPLMAGGVAMTQSTPASPPLASGCGLPSRSV